MRAVGYQQSLPIEDDASLIDIELADPSPTGHDLLVAVSAISVNPVDTKIRKRAQAEAGEHKVLGFDAVGVVQAVGDRVNLFKPGDAVYYAGDAGRPGSNAQLHLVDERIVGRKPSNLSDAQAAALPLTTITAWEMIFDRLQLPRDSLGNSSGKGKQLLIIGAAGGVGSIMIQLAKALTEMTVIATASRPETVEWVTAMGADVVIDHRQSLSEQLNQLALNKVGHVASLTHTDQHFSDIIELLEPQGKLALIDDPTEPLDVMLLKRKCLSLHWEMMFARPMFTTDDIIEQHKLLNEVASLIEAGTIKTTMTANYGEINAANLKRAHAAVEQQSTIGKIVLEGF